MKKIMTMLLATLVSSALFVACGDDDDNDNGNGIDIENGGNGNGGVSSIENPLQKEGNLLLSEITVSSPGYDEYTLNLEYDDNLRPIGCYYLGGDWDDHEYEFKVDYNKGIMEWDTENCSVSLNSKGYITKLTSEYSKNEDGETYISKSEQNFTYDEEGHLLTVVIEWQDEYRNPSMYEKITEKVSTVYTWENGNLVADNATGTCKTERNGKVYNDTTSCVDTFAYGSLPNKFKQYVGVLDEESGTLASGLFGVFSEKLPTTYTEYYHQVSDIGGEHNEYEEYNGTFTLNPDGSINTETWTNADGTPFSSYVYRYTTIDQKAPSLRSNASTFVPKRTSSAGSIKEKMRSMRRLPFMPKRVRTSSNYQK